MKNIILISGLALFISACTSSSPITQFSWLPGTWGNITGEVQYY